MTGSNLAVGADLSPPPPSADAVFDAEQAVLGALLRDVSRLAEVELSADDFAHHAHAQVYATIAQLAAANEAVDSVTVAETLHRDTGKQGWLQVTGRLAKQSVSPVNAAAYAGWVRTDAQRRQAVRIAEALRQDAGADGAVDQAIRELMALTTERRSHEYTGVQAVQAAADELDELWGSGDGRLAGVSTGWRDLDYCLGGLHSTDLVVVGARPSVGKTSWLLNLALRSQAACGIVSAEQGYVQAGQRMMAVQGRVSVHRMRIGRLKDEDWPRVTHALSAIANHRLWIYDRPAPNIDHVRRVARKWRYQYGMELLLIDYLQRIYPTNMKADRRLQVAEVTMALKELARELDIPVVVLAQVKREVESRANKRPMVSDLKEAGEIEQEADQIMLLYRDEVYDEDSPDQGIMEINIAKNRHGPCGTIRCAWLADTMRVEDLAI